MTIRAVAAAIAVLSLLGGTAVTESTPDPTAPATSTPSATGGIRIEAATPDAAGERAAQLVDAMSLREQAASVVMGHIPTTDAASLHDYMASTGIGGFILMGANIPASEDQLRALTTALTINPALPPLLAIDQEGGDVSRLPWDGFASSLDLKAQPADAATRAFAARGALVQRAGIGVNFGVVADIADDRGSFIYRRALGTTPDDAAARVGAAVQGEGPFTASTLKHFPGHGAAPGDSHRLIPSTSMPYEEWRATEAVPFAAGIDAGAPLLMFGHLAYTSVDETPASLSTEWHRIAREELGFEGVAITDDLGMLQASGIDAYADPVANAIAALVAGNDMVLAVMFSTADTAPRMIDGIVAAVEAGTLDAARLREATVRVTTLRLEMAAAGQGLIPCAECSPVG